MWVYVVECGDGTYYTGVAVDVNRRIQQHNDGKGAKYTRGRGPVRLVASRLMPNPGEALRLEALVKKQRKDRKVEVLLGHGKDPQVPENAAPGRVKAPEG